MDAIRYLVKTELIDTLWNVNMHPIRERLAHGRN